MTKILSLRQIKEGLKDKRLYVIAKVTGLTYPTLKKLADGKDSNCTMKTLQKVSSYLTASN